MHASASSGSLNAIDATPSGCLCSANTITYQQFIDATDVKFIYSTITLKQDECLKLTSKRMTFLTTPNFSHSVRKSSRYSFSTSGSSYEETTEINTLNRQSPRVHVCFSPHLKVTGMKHVPNDDDFFMPLPHFSFLLWPPVQLSTQTQTNRQSVRTYVMWK